MDRAADITAQNLFGIVHREYYEPLSKYDEEKTYKEQLQKLVPESSWSYTRSDVWLHVQNKNIKKGSPKSSYKPQGFKIHLSCEPQSALSILETVVPVLVKEEVNFKIACDEKILNQLNSKMQPRGGSGKFMTIYPPTTEAFKELIEKIYLETKDKDFKGPYILSDKRYKDSRILYYRYGGFHPVAKLNIDGSQTYYMIGPEGEQVVDERHPYFSLPDWAEDPFEDEVVLGEGEGTLLNDRYVIDGVFGFSNAGGVYFGKDTLTDKEIIVKEARPYTNYWKVDQEHWDAVHLLEREYKILQHLKGLSFVPEPIDLFTDWEHTFMVEERVDGGSLDNFWAGEEQILGPYIRQEDCIDRFIPKFKDIAIKVIEMVKAVHERGVLLGDVSPRNILINSETLQCWMIDFESAVFVDDNEQILKYATQWGTEGFVNPERRERERLTPKDDWYAVGMMLYSSVVPANNLFGLCPDKKALFIDEFTKLGLPGEIKESIQLLLKGEHEKAIQLLRAWDSDKSYQPVPLKKSEQDIKADRKRLGEVTEGIAQFINASANHQRNDRLWPAHYPVFFTNPLNITYGASGTALFLTETSQGLPTESIEWMLRQPLDNDHYPPGLFMGLAGIAYTFDQIGKREEAEKVMDMLYQSPMLYDEASIFLGMAGWGWVSLHFYTHTEKGKYLEYAIKAGEKLLETAQEKEGNYFWPYHLEETTHYGYGYGASGVGLFLLYLHVATERKDFLDFAIKGLNFDLEQKVESKVGLQWKRFEDDVLLYPYFIHGSAGIGSVLIRYYQVLQEETYKKMALEIADSAYIKYSFIPSQFEGLAGIGDFLIDAYLCSEDKKYLEYALDISESILWFGIKKTKGIAFPGRWLTRLSNDYATGSAGIGLFFSRLLKQGSRHFMDLDLKKLSKLREKDKEITTPVTF